MTISSRSAKKFFEEVEVMFPFTIQAVISDNGSEYQGEFHEYLLSRNITIYEEFYYNDGLRFNTTEQNKALDEWNHFYNYYRYHRSLHRLTPVQFIAKFSSLNPYPSTEP